MSNSAATKGGTPASSRHGSGVSASTAPAAARRSINLNSPTAIFATWTALIVVAGFGYYTVKANNTQKKKEFMIRQGQAGAGVAGNDTGEVGTGVQPGYTPGNNEKLSRSPLQSLTAAFTRQTDQRSRSKEQ